MTDRVAQCSCGSVELEAVGAPMMSVVCYCDTCQDAARRFEALPHAPSVHDADGGSAYTLFRKDRVRYTKGAHLLRDLARSEVKETSRVYASCCNTPMLMRFENGLHWVPIYRARFRDDVPPVQYRICTKWRTATEPLPDDVPHSAMYPFGFGLKLLTSKLAMLLRLP